MIRLNGHFVVFFVVTVASLCLANADDSSKNNVDCVKKIINWCNSMDYATQGIGQANLLTTDIDDTGKYQRIHCTSDSNGSSCFKNNLPWFTCTSDHKLTYKGTELRENSTIGADEEICYTAHIIEYGTVINTLNYNNPIASKVIKDNKNKFHTAMSEFHENMDKMQRVLARSCFPFCRTNPFLKDFPFGSLVDSSSDELSSSDSFSSN